MQQKDIHFIDTEKVFREVAQHVSECSWFGFDTEFIGEKSFVPKLCLLQLVTKEAIFLLDTIRLGDLTPLLESIENPDILTITHAGDNDYRLLYQLYGTVPQNTFDTQIAAGFCGYNYPAGFSKIVDGELRISVKKGYAVADWETRPLPEKVLQYAIDDVLYLPGLYESLSNKLAKNKRTEWAREENRVWEMPEHYENDPFKEAFNSDFIHFLKRPSQVFLMRIYAWRLETAAKRDVPKDSVLPNKHVSNIVRAISRGGNAFKNNRTLPGGLVRKNLETWKALYNKPITEEEAAILDALPPPPEEDPNQVWSLELAYHFVKKACMDNDISASLLLPRGVFNKLKDSNATFDKSYLTGWRKQMLGPDLTAWLLERKIMEVDWVDEKAIIREGS